MQPLKPKGSFYAENKKPPAAPLSKSSEISKSKKRARADESDLNALIERVRRGMRTPGTAAYERKKENMRRSNMDVHELANLLLQETAKKRKLEVPVLPGGPEPAGVSVSAESKDFYRGEMIQCLHKNFRRIIYNITMLL